MSIINKKGLVKKSYSIIEIPFNEKEITAVKLNEYPNEIFIAYRNMLRDIGLTKEKIKRELRNIQNDYTFKWLNDNYFNQISKGQNCPSAKNLELYPAFIIYSIKFPSDNEIRPILSVNKKVINLMLANISITNEMTKNYPDMVDSLNYYKLNIMKVLDNYFNGKIISNDKLIPIISKLVDTIKENNNEIRSLKTRLSFIENNITDTIFEYCNQIVDNMKEEFSKLYNDINEDNSYYFTGWTDKVNSIYDNNNILNKELEYNDKVKCIYEFRLINNRNEVYVFGRSNSKSNIKPLNDCKSFLKCTKIEYLDKKKKKWVLVYSI